MRRRFSWHLCIYECGCFNRCGSRSEVWSTFTRNRICIIVWRGILSRWRLRWFRWLTGRWRLGTGLSFRRWKIRSFKAHRRGCIRRDSRKWIFDRIRHGFGGRGSRGSARLWGWGSLLLRSCRSVKLRFERKGGDLSFQGNLCKNWAALTPPDLPGRVYHSNWSGTWGRGHSIDCTASVSIFWCRRCSKVSAVVPSPSKWTRSWLSGEVSFFARFCQGS